MLGRCYEDEKNYAEAVKWYLKSAEQNNYLAQNRIGELYRDGKGAAQNFTEAAKWYRKAAEQDYQFAQYDSAGYSFPASIQSSSIKWYAVSPASGLNFLP